MRPELADSLHICDGMASHVRMHDGIRMLSVEEILVQYAEMAEAELDPYLVPFGEDGAGNYYLLNGCGGDVEDLCNEGLERTPCYPSLGKYVAKAHKVTR